jgi:predicted porin
MKKQSLYALVTAGLLAGGLSVSSASAADLGGNCCADLEERIAELEATTARKGNRKVSLTVSGWVNQQVTFFDDGQESNAYVHDLGQTLGSHVKFTGSAAITPGWSAGYVLHIEAYGSDGLTHSQNEGVGPQVYRLLGGDSNGAGVSTLQSFWFLKSDQLGKVSVGLQSQASDNTAILVDGSGSLVPANWVAFDTNLMGVRRADGTLNGVWGGAQSCGGMGGAWGDCNGLTHNSVRYDSPTFGGFSVSASWGEDDFWDVAARYAGEFGGFKLAAAAAYNETTDADFNNFATLGAPLNDMDYFQAGLYLQHVASGIFGMVNYGTIDFDTNAAGTDADTWYGKIGVRTRLSSLGHTVFYGEYLNGQDGGTAQFGTNSELEVWGAGIVQEVDAAAMSVWLKYRNLSATGDAAVGALAVEDFNYVGVGALINF